MGHRFWRGTVIRTKLSLRECKGQTSVTTSHPIHSPGEPPTGHRDKQGHKPFLGPQNSHDPSCTLTRLLSWTSVPSQEGNHIALLESGLQLTLFSSNRGLTLIVFDLQNPKCQIELINQYTHSYTYNSNSFRLGSTQFKNRFLTN